MSVRIMATVWELDLSSVEKLVLLALADCANDDGLCWPSIATLKRKACVGERTVQRAIASLVSAGLLNRQEVSGRGCKYIVNPRHSGTPVNVTPRQSDAPPPPERHPTPATVAPKPSRNHKEPSEVSASGDAPLTTDEVVSGWNSRAKRSGLPSIAKLTDARTRQIRRMAKAYPVEDWQSVFAKVEQSPFLRGQNDRGWKADFDFVLNEKNFVKILEGKYDAQSA